MTEYPKSYAVSSTPLTISVKKGFLILGINRPNIFDRFVFNDLARILGT